MNKDAIMAAVLVLLSLGCGTSGAEREQTTTQEAAREMPATPEDADRGLELDREPVPTGPGAIGVGHQFGCRVTPLGEVGCWGRNDESQLGASGRSRDTIRRVPGLPQMRATDGALVVTYAGVFAVSLDGDVFHWGEFFDGQPQPSPTILTNLPNTARFVMGYGSGAICAVDDSGEERCFNNRGTVRWASVERLERSGGPRCTLEGRVFRCVGEEAAMEYDEDDNLVVDPIADDAEMFHTFSRPFHAHEICGLTPSGEVRCAGRSRRRFELVEVPGVRGVRAFGARCAIDGSDALICWGGHRPGHSEEFLSIPTVIGTGADAYRSGLCCQDGACWSQDSDAATHCRAGTLAGPGSFQCLLEQGGRLLCRDERRRLRPRAWAGTPPSRIFTVLIDGSFTTCGVVGVNVSCDWGESVQWAGVKDVVFGRSGTCLLHTDGRLRCDDDTPPMDEVAQVSGSPGPRATLCVITTPGVLACRGELVGSSSFRELGRAGTVSVDGGTLCAVSEGRVRCLGQAMALGVGGPTTWMTIEASGE